MRRSITQGGEAGRVVIGALRREEGAGHIGIESTA